MFPSSIRGRCPMPLHTKTIASPVGALTLVAGDRGLAAVLWENDRPGRVRLGPLHAAPDHPILVEAEYQLADYFAGRRTRFAVALKMAGTDFQKQVWAALLAIPFGETRSYGEDRKSTRLNSSPNCASRMPSSA